MSRIWKIAEALDLPQRLMAWNLEPLERFGPSFSGTWFDRAEPTADVLLGDACKEQRGTAWFSAVSGIEIPAPSTNLTDRPRQRQPSRIR